MPRKTRAAPPHTPSTYNNHPLNSKQRTRRQLDKASAGSTWADLAQARTLSPLPSLFSISISLPPCTPTRPKRTNTITDTFPEVADNCFRVKNRIGSFGLLGPLGPLDR